MSPRGLATVKSDHNAKLRNPSIITALKWPMSCYFTRRAVTPCAKLWIPDCEIWSRWNSVSPSKSLLDAHTISRSWGILNDLEGSYGFWDQCELNSERLLQGIAQFGLLVFGSPGSCVWCRKKNMVMQWAHGQCMVTLKFWVHQSLGMQTDGKGQVRYCRSACSKSWNWNLHK